MKVQRVWSLEIVPETEILNKTHAKVKLNEGEIKLKVFKIIEVWNNKENTPMLHMIISSKETHETINVAWLEYAGGSDESIWIWNKLDNKFLRW